MIRDHTNDRLTTAGLGSGESRSDLETADWIV